ncbi:MAG: hypothetical protein HY040_00195 [Planctomycetes bacterium]|nr:hypothetical protein [Planctomycetota bacterium]
MSEDAVFVASWYAHQIYKFDFEGNLLNTFCQRGARSISKRDEFIVVHFAGKEQVLDDPAFRVKDPGATTAAVERTWWGHPLLVVRRADGVTTIAPLQPWYMTVLWNTYPGALWLPIAVVLGGVALWTRKRIRGLDQSAAAITSFRSTEA